MKKISLVEFLKHYIGFVLVLVLIYFILGPSNGVSIPFLMLIGLPITAVMLFTGWDEKLKKWFP